MAAAALELNGVLLAVLIALCCANNCVIKIFVQDYMHIIMFVKATRHLHCALLALLNRLLTH